MNRILVLGGSGFVGRHVVAKLSAAGRFVTVITRSRERARHLILLPTVEVIEADPSDPAVLARYASGAAAAIHLVGIINERGRETFARVHVELTRAVVNACVAARVPRLLHMSALNADPAGPSRYLRSKGEAEAIVAGSPLDWTIFRPSVIFGREDTFLNLFARLVRVVPVIALAAPRARFQPVYVGDVAHCFAQALTDDLTIGQRYELCGPRVYTLLELVKYVNELTGSLRPVIPLGPALSRLQATMLEFMPGKLMTRDNLNSMQRDSVCSCPFPALFGITPVAVEALAPQYLAPDSLRSRYDVFRTQSGR